MKCREIIEILETLAPKSCACDWESGTFSGADRQGREEDPFDAGRG